MNNNANQPAYPTIEDKTDDYGIKYRETTPGFTKREAIAMAAMQGLCVNNVYLKTKDLVDDAVSIADALLKALEQPQQ